MHRRGKAKIKKARKKRRGWGGREGGKARDGTVVDDGRLPSYSTHPVEGRKGGVTSSGEPSRGSEDWSGGGKARLPCQMVKHRWRDSLKHTQALFNCGHGVCPHDGPPETFEKSLGTLRSKKKSLFVFVT